MITRIVLGDGTILKNVDDIQEIVQNNGNYILNGLTINIIKDEDGISPSVSEIETTFSKPNVLEKIRIYKKDLKDTQINEETKEEIRTYGDEYLALETSKYTGIQSIYKHVESDRISIQLTADPTKLADDKYNQLIVENETLKQSIAELTAMMAMSQTPKE